MAGRTGLEPTTSGRNPSETQGSGELKRVSRRIPTSRVAGFGQGAAWNAIAVMTGPYYGTYMTKRLTRSGNSLALVIDRPLLEALDIDADTELELSTDGDVLVVTPLRDPKRRRRVAELVAEAHEQYGGVFRRLAE